MSSEVRRLDVDELIEHCLRRCRRDRYLLGLAGPPGAGKSTIAERLRVEAGAVVAPMDGFHRRHHDLVEAHLVERKGAPVTFDAGAFVGAVERVSEGRDDVSWPAFDRVLDDPVAGASIVPADARLVVVEGNYLLLDAPPWNRVPPLLDDVAHIELDPDLRRARLVARHIEFGKSASAAADFVTRSDEANAAVVDAARHRATLSVTTR